jgi:hypothetical protein
MHPKHAAPTNSASDPAGPGTLNSVPIFVFIGAQVLALAVLLFFAWNMIFLRF